MSPLVLSTVCQARDLAWLEIAGNYGTEATKSARNRLARIILANPLCEDATADVLKRAGLVTMAAAERTRDSVRLKMGGRAVVVKRQSKIRNEIHAHLRSARPDPGTHCREALSTTAQRGCGRRTEGGDRVRRHRLPLSDP